LANAVALVPEKRELVTSAGEIDDRFDNRAEKGLRLMGLAVDNI
jgi:hypothetical protein